MACLVENDEHLPRQAVASLRRGSGFELAARAIIMSIIGWVVLGLLAGFIASKIVNKSGEGVFLDIALGIVGALVGGFVFNLIGDVGVTGFNIWSLFVAVIGAILVLGAFHLISGHRRRFA